MNYSLYRYIPKADIDFLKSLVNEENIYSGDLAYNLERFKPIHIGKSSKGWQFLFDHNNWEYYEGTKASINAFLQDEILKGGRIIDESLNEITLKELWEIVESHKDGLNAKSGYERDLKLWQEYKANPNKNTYFKPIRPIVWDNLEIISDSLRFSTKFS